MKLLFSFFILPFLFAQTGFYDLSITSLQGGQVNLSAYQGRKVVVAVLNPANPDVSQLRLLDSLQAVAGGNVVVIGVPATDLDSTKLDASAVSQRYNSFSANIVFTAQAAVRKSSGSNQHPLLQWLTDVNQNQHFNNDASAEGMLFVVSEKGTLFAVLDKQVPAVILNDVFNRKLDE